MQYTMPMSGLFPLGRLVMTPGATRVLAGLPDGAAGRMLARHHSGDWGDVDKHDWAVNQRALRRGHRLVSVYGEGDNRLYIITEADRTVTTFLTPQEY